MDGDGAELRALVRARRRELGLTQEGLAEQVGMSVAWVTKIENGRFVPSPDAIRRLAAATGLPAARLIAAGGLAQDRLEAERLAQALPRRHLDRSLKRLLAVWPELSPAVHEHIARTAELFGRGVGSDAGEEG